MLYMPTDVSSVVWMRRFAPLASLAPLARLLISPLFLSMQVLDRLLSLELRLVGDWYTWLAGTATLVASGGGGGSTAFDVPHYQGLAASLPSVPKGCMAFLQNQFQCPPMLGAQRV